jgi:peptidoglycan/LPS O-acetylase OafA/YrhL
MAQRVYFKGLDFLRFIAAFAVLVFHSSQWYHYQFDTPFKMFLHNLPVAVDFFFMLSGFLIIYLLLVEKGNTGTVSLKNFYIRRFLRIFPLYYLIILIAYLFLQTDHDKVDWDKFLYFWGNFWLIGKNAWTLSALNPLWSISIEEHFYLFIPFLVLITPAKYLKYILWTIIASSFAFRIYATLSIPDNWMTIYMHTFSQMDLLAAGGLLALYHYHHPIRFQLPLWIYMAMLFAFILLMTLVDSKNYSTVYLASVKKYLFDIPLLFLLIFFVFSDNKSFDKLKNQKILNYLGKISYGIYLYNALFIDLLDRNQWLHEHYFVKFILDVFITLTVAALSYELFEKQFLKLKYRFKSFSAR